MSDIGWAVEQLWGGKRVRRAGWNGRGMSIGLQRRDEGSVNTLPYVYIITVTGDRVPWVCSQTDLLALDWREV